MPETEPKQTFPAVRVYDVDETLKRKLGIRAAAQGFRSMSSYVKYLIEQDVRENP